LSRVKIVATIGPVTDNAAKLTALHQAGMDIARLNGSHADLGWHRYTSKLMARCPRAVLCSMPKRIKITGLIPRTIKAATMAKGVNNTN